MPYVEKFAPNFNTVSRPGMCLALVEDAYNTPEPYTSAYGCARESWDASGFKHETNEMPGVPVPVFFSWVGTIDGVTKDWGDARIFVPGRGVFGSPLKWSDPVGNSWVADLNEIERLLPGAKYLGWTEDISGFRVVDYVEAPQPEPAPEPAPAGNVYVVQPGDCLSVIGDNLGIDWNVLYENNRDIIGDDPDLIHPGQELRY